jgi:hypothetical protein
VTSPAHALGDHFDHLAGGVAERRGSLPAPIALGFSFALGTMSGYQHDVVRGGILDDDPRIEGQLSHVHDFLPIVLGNVREPAPFHV